MRRLLLFLAGREGFRNFALKFGIFRRSASRFVAGETLADALEAVRRANGRNLLGILDLLGEHTRTPEDAARAAGEIAAALDAIRDWRVRSQVSVKLTQLGLALDPALALANLTALAGKARGLDNFVWVDMEESAYTRSTLEIVTAVHRGSPGIGVAIQAYLYRSEEDVRAMVRHGIPVRLVKGAYLEPPGVAFARKSQTDASYLKLMRMLLEGGATNAIATHDEALIDAALAFARSRGIAPDRFEFQMLYGIRRDLQAELAREGYRVRIYIPYGRQWYPYFMRRLAERPANVGFILRNMFKG
ncbi:MAG: proline dehydrogenase family protein [Acidobacteria bacterium]|nr:proline dehydrogenase family protein [Acidobacteriota bacterium]